MHSCFFPLFLLLHSRLNSLVLYYAILQWLYTLQHYSINIFFYLVYCNQKKKMLSLYCCLRVQCVCKEIASEHCYSKIRSWTSCIVSQWMSPLIRCWSAAVDQWRQLVWQMCISLFIPNRWYSCYTLAWGKVFAVSSLIVFELRFLWNGKFTFVCTGRTGLYYNIRFYSLGARVRGTITHIWVFHFVLFCASRTIV